MLKSAMPILTRLALVTCISGALGGCLNLATADPYPVYGNPVNPTPVRGYRLECESRASPTNFIFNDYLSGCRQVIDPVGSVVRARG